MPGIDWIPVVSQVKAFAQAVTGDTEGAKRTAENFVRECPGVSQVTSVVQLCSGDVQGAVETQRMCLGTVNNVANGIPVVGHAKCIIHHAVGDHEGGDQAIKAATRSTVVMASGAAAGITTGGLAAIPAGIAAGVAYDATESAITGKPEGYVAAIKNVADNPSAGTIIDALAIPVGDGMAGYSGGQIGSKIQLSRLENLRAAAIENMESAATPADALKYASEVKSLTAEINRLQPSSINVNEPKSRGSVVNEAKLQHLEDLKASALEKMDAATTSGEALKYGAEAKALHAEINNMKGVPHFTDSPKAAKVVPGTSASNIDVPVAGYINKDDEEQGTSGMAAGMAAAGIPRAIPMHDVVRDDALRYDSYVEVIVTDSNKRAEAQREMRERDKQEASRNILESYQNVKFTTIDGLADLLRSTQDPNRPHDNDWRASLRQLFSWSWLLLNMPQEFNYTAVTQVNSVYSGLLHSFIRHIFEWEDVIPSLAPQIRRLAPIMREIERTTAANTESDARTARDAFVRALNELQARDRQRAGDRTETTEQQDIYNDIQSAFVEIQMEQHRFMEQYMTYENYLGRSVNTYGQQRLYFRVESPSGPKAMVVCLSNDLFQPVAGNARPVRMLMTVFFESWAVFTSHGLLETKKEMEDNNKNNKKR